MLANNLLLIITLLMVVALLSMLSNKLRVSYPIFLVLAGLVIGMVPMGLHISLDSDLVFLIFLPPLLFEAAWNSSWNELWKYRRSISRLSLGLVLFTSLAIAFLAHWLIPRFGLAFGFLLGGIISPPDAVAATSVLNGLKVPRRVKAILEGESLINDASSLIIFSFALTAVETGKFVWWQAGISFFQLALLGIAIGLLLGYLMHLIIKYLPTTPSIDTTISFIFPYIAYLTAEHFHVSGVLAVVTGGLFLNFKSHSSLAYNSRLQIKSVWSMAVFLLNGAVFIMIGLQLPDIISALGGYSLGQAIRYGLIISVAAILVRFIWVYPITAFFEILRHKITGRKSFNPMAKSRWKSYFIIAWSGMRGVVSLASGLAVPYYLDSGNLFPHRNLILFITFIVILVTLVIQGLLLPLIIRWLKIEADTDSNKLDYSLEVQLARDVIHFMDDHYLNEIANNENFKRVRNRYIQLIDDHEQESVIHDIAKRNQTQSSFYKMSLEIIALKRKALGKFRKEDVYPDAILRNKEFELDLEEARIRRSNVR